LGTVVPFAQFAGEAPSQDVEKEPTKRDGFSVRTG
jgi:hypothetical protein